MVRGLLGLNGASGKCQKEGLTCQQEDTQPKHPRCTDSGKKPSPTNCSTMTQNEVSRIALEAIPDMPVMEEPDTKNG